VTIGEALAEARNQIGLTISEVSERTRVRETIIRDIERDDYSSCGADFYARGHIRAIARVVNIDPAPLIEEYDQAHGWQSGGDLPHPTRPTDYSPHVPRVSCRRPRLPAPRACCSGSVSSQIPSAPSRHGCLPSP
jgi:cytoskeletal protein RodZ